MADVVMLVGSDEHLFERVDRCRARQRSLACASGFPIVASY